uniref:NADH dehydrogenase subunit 6 n=1 Tax=Panagrolaimus sp. JU765 TaxID=591449 RepID=A0AC34Q4L7_9BILA
MMEIHPTIYLLFMVTTLFLVSLIFQKTDHASSSTLFVVILTAASVVSLIMIIFQFIIQKRQSTAETNSSTNSDQLASFRSWH